MKYDQLLILLPCHSLEDFPLHHLGDDAEGLLAGWSSLWHPALVASAGAMPTWQRADDPPRSLTDALVVIPSVSEPLLPPDLATRARNDGALMIRNEHVRDKIVRRALEPLNGKETVVDSDLAADFLALGFCFLQVELLTRQMRYSSNLDEDLFQNQVVAAARAAMAGNHETTRERLAACFDSLAEQKDHYYPVDSYILDLTLVASTTMGHTLRDALQAGPPINLMMTAEVIRNMQQSEPASLNAVREAVETGRACLIGGELTERNLPWLSEEAILAGLSQGLDMFQHCLGQRPTVFGRRRFGLTPLLPQVLTRLGFEGALHATLDDGRFPVGSHAKVRWEGLDGTGMDVVAKPPVSASLAETFLNYSVKLGESMDMDHVATICLAHWPGQTALWFDDLIRISKFGSVLGKFVTFREYLQETDLPAHSDRFGADQYRSPYLLQSVIRKQRDPISSCVRHHGRRAKWDAARSLATLATLIRGDGDQVKYLSDAAEPDDDTLPDGEGVAWDLRLEKDLTCALSALAESLPRRDASPRPGYLVFNPCNFSRRIGVMMPEMEGNPAAGDQLYATGHSASGLHVVVDVPPMGFTQVSEPSSSAGPLRSSKAVAHNNVLRNEHMQVHINPTTGSLQSLYDFRTRGNRLSQQLAYRLPSRQPEVGEAWTDPDDSASYSVMAADSVEVTVASGALGEIVCHGRLLEPDGKALAGFRQTYRLWRGSRVLQVDIELETHQEPLADPWNSYFACRFAWADPGANLLRSVGLTRQPTSEKRFEAPLFVEVDMPDMSTALLTGGLPYHRRVGHRMLDSLLVVRGESARRFRLGIGIDVPHPVQEALTLITPDTLLFEDAPPTAPHNTGWLFHIDAKNIVATHWQPQIDANTVVGFRVRLRETAGHSGPVAIQSFRPIAEARRLDFLGGTLGECEVADGTIQLLMQAGEWVEVEGRWA